MFSSVLSAEIHGVEAVAITVEADVSDGMPVFNLVGCAGTQVKESWDRVKTSFKNMRISMPPKRITVNLFPGDLRKDGTRYDLPIAAAILGAIGKIPPDILRHVMVLGELHLDGRVGAISGILPSVFKAREMGLDTVIVPHENKEEAEIVSGIRIISIRSLEELLLFSRGKAYEQEESEETETDLPQTDRNCGLYPDFGDIKGQTVMKRACMIAASGFHNILFCGPPGSGKSMAARRIPSILPLLSEKESLEITQIYSIAGLLPQGAGLMTTRPFRSPHYSLSSSALCGGGLIPKPGEITLAHNGVLFLDELPEMSGRTLEKLRQPLEDREILIARSSGNYIFPANFLLVGAYNYCPCGLYPDLERCTCTPREIIQYQKRISTPILDRIDLRCEVAEVSLEDIKSRVKDDQTSKRMRDMVTEACLIQKDRYGDSRILFNSQLSGDQISKYCCISDEADRLLGAVFKTWKLSARAYHHLLKTARTIADLDHESLIKEAHIAEALNYRVPGKQNCFSTGGAS